MKKSKYTIFTSISENEHIASNLVTGSVIIMDNIEFDIFNKILQDPKLGSKLEPEMYGLLLSEGFLVQDNIDELRVSKALYWKAKMDRNTLRLTIIPTFSCNLNCSYCYQKGTDRAFMKEDVSERILKFISSRISTIKCLSVNWFGGEPLLCIDFIEKMALKIIKLCNDNNVEYISTIATNGYLLNKEVINILKNIKIKQISTTLAGIKEIHDELRSTLNRKPTFETIINNIKLAKEHFKIMISINITENNINSICDLIDFMSENCMKENIYISFDQVIPFKNNPCNDICVSNNEFNNKVLKMYHYALKKGLNICDMTKFNQCFVYCGTDYENSYTIDANANVYKCAEVYDDTSKIGLINDNGDLEAQGYLHLNLKDPFNNAHCRDCNLLPYCFGGCSNKSNCGKDFCPSEKECIEEYLKLFYIRQHN